MSLFTIPSLYLISFFLPGYNSSEVSAGHPLEIKTKGEYITSITGSAIIDGFVKTKNNAPVANALVYLAENPEFSASESSTTDATGYYNFSGIEKGKDYFLKVYKNDDPKNGISTIDLVRIQRHLLGNDVFTSLDQFIAADANRSVTVSAIDLVEIRKLLLGIYTELPNNTSWRFLTLPVDLSDLSATLMTIKTIENLSVDHLGVDFLGIKIGDLSGN